MPGLRPFFCFFGGKWRAVPHYPKPLHRRIIEPFAGAAGYATRYSDHDVVLVEKDPRIAALWRWLIAPTTTADVILSLPLWTGKYESIDDVPGLDAEARDLMGFWFNKGSAQPHRRPSTWMTSKVRPNSHWGETIRALLAAQIHAIKHWTIIEGDWTSAPDDLKATWFVDPPYQVDGRKYKCSSKDLDFRALGDVCRSLAANGAQVIACENTGADWLDFKSFRAIKASPGAQKKRSTDYTDDVGHRSVEVIWTGDVVEQVVAALYVDERGPYTKLKNVRAYGVTRDARTYADDFPVVAHPPCERWGRYATGGPNPLARRRRVGADGGCFASALANVRRCGGVLEHPAHSKAFAKFKLPIPDRNGGWSSPDEYSGRSCHIEQGNYGHPARKATWLYAVKCDCDAFQLRWGAAPTSRRLDLGPHSKAEAQRWRREGKSVGKRLSKDECVHTPVELRDVLLALARSAR